MWTAIMWAGILTCISAVVIFIFAFSKKAKEELSVTMRGNLVIFAIFLFVIVLISTVFLAKINAMYNS